MSLINKMLNDLEKRDASLYENKNTVLNGLSSAYDLELTNKEKHSSLSKLFILLCLITILLITINYFSDNFKYHPSIVAVIEPVVDSPEVSKEVVGHKEGSIVPIRSTTNNLLKLDNDLLINSRDDERSISKSTDLNRVNDIYFETNEQGVNLVLKMPKDIDYLVYGLNNPSRVVIEIDNAELDFLLEDLEPVEPIVAIRYSINKKNRFKLVLESEQLLNIRKSIESKSGKDYNLVVVMESEWKRNTQKENNDNVLIDIVDNQVDLEKDIIFKGDLVKSPVSKNKNAYADKIFKQAYADYKNGNVASSLKKLNTVLNHDASHVNARSTLAMILSEQGHTNLAYSVLNEGLIQYPDKSDWLKMKARLLLNEGKLVQAKEILVKQKPDLSTNVEYYALFSAVLQKLDEHSEAAKIYRNLLRINPSKSIWWMGLGISLESLKRYDDALYAYQKAYKNSSLAADSKDFLTKRITLLSNLLKDEST